MSQARYCISHHSREDIFRRLKAIQQTAEFGDTQKGQEYIIQQIAAIKLILDGKGAELYKAKRPEPDPEPVTPKPKPLCPACKNPWLWPDADDVASAAAKGQRQCLQCGNRFTL